jgi:helix-turn-helix protein
MSEGERKLVDTSGDYLYAVREGQPVDEPRWRSCRIVLTDQRLVLGTNDGKRAISHTQIRVLDDPDSVLPDGISLGEAIPLRIGEAVILVDATSIEDFEAEYCRAVIHDEVILVKHQAIVGGVVQDDADWSKARFRFEDDRIVLGLPGNRTASFEIEDVGTIESSSGEVAGQQRPILAVEHTDEEGRATETHFSGTDRHARALERLLRGVIEGREGDVELTETENQVLMALYSGVSPFEMAGFVGLEVDEVEEIYQKLLDAGAVDKVRERTEVSLNAHGRNLASEAMNEQ